MNQLANRAAFEAVLADYHPSENAKQLLAQTKLVLFIGPTSTGRNTIINKLTEDPAYHYIVSDTTRQPRENNGILEQNGREYWFRTEDDMLADLRAGQFLEAAIIHNQQVSGMSIREVAEAAQKGLISMSEIEVVGADNVHAAKPDTIFFFILPPSFDEWMVRMNARGVLPADEVRRRLQSAVQEITTALERDFYHFVINDTFVHAAKKIDDMIKTGVFSEEDQSAARTLAAEIRDETEAWLATH